MSLVTRCTACGTLFKVVADQLKISEGWVRCGQCAHVFDAQASLVPSGSAALQHEPNTPKIIASDAASMPANSIEAVESSVSREDLHGQQRWQPSDGEPGPAASQTRSQSAPIAPVAVDLPPGSSSAGLIDHVSQGFQSERISAPAPALPDSQRRSAADSRAFKPGLLRDSQELDSEIGPSTASWPSSDYASRHASMNGIPVGRSVSQSTESSILDGGGLSKPYRESLPADLIGNDASEFGSKELTTQPQPAPSFVRQAQRAARWRSPWVRAGLSLVALMLLGVLGLQVTWQEKDRIAAMYPQTKPWLDQLCGQIGCRVEAFKRIESIIIDSSSFNRINKNNPPLEAVTQSYKLAVTLKNTGHLAVALPSIELSLQDTQDQPILRRILSPADLGTNLDRLQPAQELTGALTVQLSTAQLAGSRINGYRVLAFYP